LISEEKKIKHTHPHLPRELAGLAAWLGVMAVGSTGRDLEAPINEVALSSFFFKEQKPKKKLRMIPTSWREK
jgi:hypothetical protein